MSEEQYTPEKADDSRLEAHSGQKAARKNLPPLLRLNRRVVIFLGLQTLALILYYISGNIQFFLESNMQVVLQGMTLSAIALALFCAAGVAECVFYALSWKEPRFFLKVIPYGIILLLSIVFAVFSRTVDLLSLGY